MSGIFYTVLMCKDSTPQLVWRPGCDTWLRLKLCTDHVYLTAPDSSTYLAGCLDRKRRKLAAPRDNHTKYIQMRHVANMLNNML